MFDKFKSNLLRFLGSTANGEIRQEIEQATTQAELDTVMEKLPSISEQITTEIEKASQESIQLVTVKMNEEVSKLITELNTNLSSVLASQNQKIEQIGKSFADFKVKASAPAPTLSLAPIPPKPSDSEVDKTQPAPYNLVMSAVKAVPISPQF